MQSDAQQHSQLVGDCLSAFLSSLGSGLDEDDAPARRLQGDQYRVIYEGFGMPTSDNEHGAVWPAYKPCLHNLAYMSPASI